MTTYGIGHLWSQGDLMTRGVACLLTAMSVISWAVIVMKAIELGSMQRRADYLQRNLCAAGSIAGTVGSLGRPGTPFFDLVSAGQSALAHHDVYRNRLEGQGDAGEWLATSLRMCADAGGMRLQRGLGLLASIGSTAPFVGLLGTVWGIYHALLALGAGGDASLDRVAGPVGEALIMTALGLCVAIPAVLGYNMLARLARDILVSLRRFAEALPLLLLTDSVPVAATMPDAPIGERV